MFESRILLFTSDPEIRDEMQRIERNLFYQKLNDKSIKSLKSVGIDLSFE